MRRLVLPVIVLGLLAAAVSAPQARADGDPGSDVLVYQPLFLNGDAGISVPQQARLGALLGSAAHSGFPVRVAIIATPQDLGAVTELWRNPRAYARFLGLEISLAYTGRLLVVMPNGFGFNWPGHASGAAYRTLNRLRIGLGGAGLSAAAETAVRSLAADAHVKLGAAGSASPAGSAAPNAAPSQPAPGGSSTDTTVAIVALAILAAAGLAALIRRRLGRRPRFGLHLPHRPPVLAVSAAATLLAGAALAALITAGSPASVQSDALATNPELDPGTTLAKAAPGFTLTDQLGRQVSLNAYRGKVVLLAFNDSECTTICPLTTSAMLDAKAMLGRAGSDVQLLGVDANPKATSIEDVLSYSQLHGMVGAWHFLTGTLPELRAVWKGYGVQAAIQGGQIAHTPALFVIDPQGQERKLYMTQQSYAAIGQLGQLLAREASSLLPAHPAVNSNLSYSQVAGINPATPATLARAGGGTVHLGAGRPRLYAFFATWDRQVTGLAGGLEGLGGYDAMAQRLGLPRVTAVDEASVEPRGGLAGFLSTLPARLPYPVAVDRAGRVGDGYEVEGLPWLMLVSGRGRIAWYYSVSALGWPSTSYLITRVRQALAYVGAAPAGARAAQAALAGSPAALAALHQQASRLLGGEPQLAARIRALRGYPIVINVWASWCVPCRSEFGLFASASTRFGRRVAFLGSDTDDSPGDAQSFLEQHPVSYPSYQLSTPQLTAVVPQGVLNLPTTIFIDRRGKLASVHTGQYDSQGNLDGDIQTYALGG